MLRSAKAAAVVCACRGVVPLGRPVPARPATSGDGGGAGRAAGAVTTRYEALVAGGFRDDESQRAVLPLLDALVAAIPAHHVATQVWRGEWGAWDARRRAARERLLSSEDARRRSRSESVVALMRDRMRAVWDKRTEAEVEAAFAREVEARSREEAGAEPPAPVPPRGVFLHGAVGVGKTFAMDLVAAAVRDVGGGTLRRVHFNELFLDMHARMHALLSEGQRGTLRRESPGASLAGAEEEAPVGAFHAVADELLEGVGIGAGVRRRDAVQRPVYGGRAIRVPWENPVARRGGGGYQQPEARGREPRRLSARDIWPIRWRPVRCL